MICVSIIVPVYNTNDFLSRCLDSILNQSFSDFEIILINDGSTDNSINIIRQYKKKDSRIVVIDKKNEGVSASRNVGLDYARGKYIMFCDSDDYVETDWVQKLFYTIEGNPDSFICCEYSKVNAINGTVNRCRIPDIEEISRFSKKEYFKMYYHGYSSNLWNRIYRKDIIEKYSLHFDETVKQAEDSLFNIEYLKYCSDIIYLSIPLYYWVDNNLDTLSRGYFPDFYDILKILFSRRIQIIDEKDKQKYYDICFYRFYLSLESVFDRRNTAPLKKKIAYCKYILNDSTFIDVTNHASKSQCGKRLKKILNTRNFWLWKGYTGIIQFKKIVS